jgi:hypothetical protein
VEDDVGLFVAAAVWLRSICGSTLVLIVEVSVSATELVAADTDELSSLLSLILRPGRQSSELQRSMRACLC